MRCCDCKQRGDLVEYEYPDAMGIPTVVLALCADREACEKRAELGRALTRVKSFADMDRQVRHFITLD